MPLLDSHTVHNYKRCVLIPIPKCLQSPQVCFLWLQDLWKCRCYRLICKIPSWALPSGSNIISKLWPHFQVLYPTHFLHLVAHLPTLEAFSVLFCLPISLFACNVFSSLEAKKKKNSSGHPEAILSPHYVSCTAVLCPKISVSQNPVWSQIQHFTSLNLIPFPGIKCTV